MNDLMTKSFLSYVELKKQARIDMEDLEEGGGGAIPAGERNLSKFFQEVAAVRSEMEDISGLLTHIQTLNEDAKSTHSAKLLRGLRDQTDSDTVAVLRKAQTVRAMLEALDRSNAASRGRPEFQPGSSVDRTRTAVTGGLRIKLRETMSQFRALREKILWDRREDLRRTVYNATGREPTEASTERMSLEEVVAGKEAAACVEGKERHGAAVDIQRSLNKLHQVFLDMAVLVEKQEEGVESIEQNVAEAGKFISGGTDSLYYADQMKKKKKRWAAWVWLVGIIILLVCFVAMLTS